MVKFSQLVLFPFGKEKHLGIIVRVFDSYVYIKPLHGFQRDHHFASSTSLLFTRQIRDIEVLT